MSITQVCQMEAGPEFDRLVADACGMKAIKVRYPSGELVDFYEALPEPVHAHAFQPSVDWNWAMLAAERFNLFRQFDVNDGWEGLRFLTHCNGWCVSEWTKENSIGYRVVASGKTGPITICRAILTLAAG